MLNAFRDKSVIFLVCLILLGAMIGGAHNIAIEKGKAIFIQDAMRTLIIPFNLTIKGIYSFTGFIFDFIKPRSRVLDENDQLRQRVIELTQENARLIESANENINLKKMLGFKQSATLPLQTADVISRKESAWFDTCAINKGRTSGVKKGDPVFNYNGVVGQVAVVDTFTSQVVALTNTKSAIAAMVQRSRAQGIIQGQGSDYLVLAYLTSDADVVVNDIVITSGLGKRVPKGFAIGRVVQVVRNSVSGTASAIVKPSVRFDQLERVFLATGVNQ